MRALGSSAATIPIGRVAPAAVKPSALTRKFRRGVINLSSDITPSPPLTSRERDLFVQSILIGDAGFAFVLPEVAAVAVCPSLLIEVHITDAAKGRFGRVAILVVGVVSLCV